MTGYSFYCSKCRFDHAGECEPIAQISGAPEHYPAVGSVWVTETDRSGAWERMSGFTYEVISVDHEKEQVMVRGYMNAVSPMPVKYWRPTGAPDLSGNSRFVPAPNSP